MKMKKMKIFQTCLKYFNLHFSEAFYFADFKYLFGFFISFYDQKLQLSKVGKKWKKMGKNKQNGPTLWRAVTFDRRKI